MRRPALIVLTVAALAVGLWSLAEMTQNRPDPPVAGTTTIEWSMKTNGVDLAGAADSLWAVCRHTVREMSGPPPAGIDGSTTRFSVEVTPRLGEHARRRLLGCLQDATIDKIQGYSVIFAHHDAASPTL